MSNGNVFVVGTFDTKSDELNFIKERIVSAGVPVRTVDLSASGPASVADVAPQDIAMCLSLIHISEPTRPY